MQPFSSVDRCAWPLREFCWLVIAIVALVASALLVAQEEPPGTSGSVSTRRDPRATNARLTTRQRQAIHLLKSARGETATLDPAMRALVLWEIARGYERLGLREADELRKEAFSAALS